jgi:hypothetical protein
MATAFQITNPDGKPFTVRIVEQGDQYGLNDELTHDAVDPLVEFYDLSYAGETFDGRGQFVSRYYLSTILISAMEEPCKGILLEGSHPQWFVGGENVKEVARVGISVSFNRHLSDLCLGF